MLKYGAKEVSAGFGNLTSNKSDHDIIVILII